MYWLKHLIIFILPDTGSKWGEADFALKVTGVLSLFQIQRESLWLPADFYGASSTAFQQCYV